MHMHQAPFNKCEAQIYLCISNSISRSVFHCRGEPQEAYTKLNFHHLNDVILNYVVSLPDIYMSLKLEKLGLMHVSKVSSQISISNPHRLIRGNTFFFYANFCLKEVSCKQKSSPSVGGKYWF